MGRPKPVARSVSMNDTSWWSKRWISPNIATSISNVSICWSSKTVKSMVLASSNCSMAASTSWSNKANRLVGEWRDGHLPGYLEEHPSNQVTLGVVPWSNRLVNSRLATVIEGVSNRYRPATGHLVVILVSALPYCPGRPVRVADRPRLQQASHPRSRHRYALLGETTR